MVDRWKLRRCFPSILVFYGFVASILAQDSPYVVSNRRMCQGTENGFSMVTPIDEPKLGRMKAMYKDCQIVQGNLELTYISDGHLAEINDTTLSFLSNIEEVTGYVLIVSNQIFTLSLPKLKIIWGDKLHHVPLHNETGKKVQPFGLLIHGNSLKHLYMPSLRAVKQGNIGFVNNQYLCHWKTIDYRQFLGEEVGDRLSFDGKNYEGCGDGDGTCLGCNKCYGSNSSLCQIIYRDGCAEQCSNKMCFNVSSPLFCCHSECAAGCTGPSDSECIGCLKFRYNNKCLERCPPKERYNPVKAVVENDPQGTYAYNRQCVPECPFHMRIYREGCVSRCPEGFYENGVRCDECHGDCPKTCKILNDEPVNSLTLHKFINCTKVEGAIEIRSDTFTIGTVYDSQSKFIGKTTPLTADDLEALSSVQEITDYLFVQSGKHLKSLSFLRNLRKVDGRRLHPQSTKNSVMITGSEGLEELGLVNLVNVSFNGVLIYKNSELCYADTLPWNSSIAPPNRGNVILNRAKDQCEKEDKVCHPSCDPKTGCWGSGAGMCFQCQHYKLDSVCVDTCAFDQGFYESSPKVCDRCHAECVSCYGGPYARNCTQCRHVRLNNECIKECPRETHFVRNGICEKCHRNCYDFGCTGDGNFVGQNGCNKCKFAALHSNKTISHCLQIISAENLCSSIMKQENYYWGAVIPKLSSMVSDGVCAKCHENCRNCSGYGNDVENNQCSCVSHRVNQEQGNVQCLNSCPSNFYNETLPMNGGVVDCFPCHVSCDGCFGPSANDCLQCKTHKVFHSNNEFFKCVEECPLDQPFSDASLVCSDVDQEKLKEQIHHRQQMIIAGITATVFILLVAACIVAFIYRRNAAKLSKLNPPDELFEMNADAKPDLSQLRLIVLDSELKIDEKHPLGYGAFGVVYKGIWYRPEDKLKIPVAVKVLHEATSTAQKEMLEEAGIMARMNHKHLVRLIGVCLNQQMMLVTPLMPLGNLLDFVQTNKSKIGSAALLRWASQIADGMAHLESQRLVHRDLAARNVLVQHPYHVRITDFGLAKMLDYGEEELKIFEGKMPIKWLALECIQHRRFTHKSDVWAFGVTLWELMTFGDKPYRDVPLKQIPSLLENGERLPQPKVCTLDVYMILIKCWMVDCDSRPTFVDLRETFAKMLKDPGRYLAIEGDKLLRLPLHTKEDQCDLVRRFVDDPDVCNPDDYLDDPMTPSLPSTPTKPLLEHVGDVRSRGNQRNQSTSSHRYASDPLKNRGGPSKSVLSTDRDNYLVPDSLKSTPSNQNGSVYTPIVTSSNGDKSHMYYNELPSSPTHTDPNDSTLSADNIEYLMPNSISARSNYLYGPAPVGRNYSSNNSSSIEEVVQTETVV